MGGGGNGRRRPQSAQSLQQYDEERSGVDSEDFVEIEEGKSEADADQRVRNYCPRTGWERFGDQTKLLARKELKELEQEQVKEDEEQEEMKEQEKQKERE